MLAPLAHPACLLQLMHVMELRRNITAHRSVPIIRHVSGSAAASAAAAVTWPAIIVV